MNRDYFAKTNRDRHFNGCCPSKEMLARMKVEKGDTLYAIETAGGYLITPYDPAIEDELNAGREFMKEYRDTFKELAK